MKSEKNKEGNDVPLVSIVNVTWNGLKLLKRHLPSLKNLKYPNYEVIVVDNASTDNSVDFIKENYPEFKVIINKENLGTAEGSNVAIKVSRGKYIFWVSNDMEFDPFILNHLVSRCEADKTIGICTVKMLRIKEEKLIHEIDSVGANLDIFGFPISRGINELDIGQYDYFTEVFFSFGGAMFIRKKILDIVGEFDSDYLTLADDIDLSWRVQLVGYKVVVEPKAYLFHQVSATLNTTHNRAQKRYLSERNTLRTLLKNYSMEYLILLLPPYFALLCMEIMFFLVMRKFNIAKSGIKAVMWNLFYIKDTMKMRKRVQKFRTVDDLTIISKMQKIPEKSMVFLDFIKNKNTNKWKNFF